MKRKTIIMVFTLLVILFMGYQWFKKESKQSMGPPRTVVKTVNVLTQDIPTTIRALSTLIAIHEANIASEINASIKSLHFNDGALVKQGDLLIGLDDASQQARLLQALAQQNLAQTAYDRARSLHAKGALPSQDLDKADADLKVAKADVTVAQAELAKTQIRAPFDGRLGDKNISVGQYITTGETLTHIVDKKQLKMQYAVPERYLNALKMGAPVTLTTAAFPDETFSGKVDYISPFVDKRTRTIMVEALFDNPQERLAPGLSGQITQVLINNQNARVIPEEALVPSITGYFVYKVVENKAVRVPVELGSRFQGMAHVTAGLEPNDVIVSQGQQGLREGALLEIVNAEPAGA